MTSIQERMTRLNLKQVDLIFRLREKGVIVQPPEMSTIIRGAYTSPKAQKVLELCDKILTEIEKEST